MSEVKLPSTVGLFTQIIKNQTNRLSTLGKLTKDVHELIVDLLKDNKIEINTTGYSFTSEDMIVFIPNITKDGHLDLKVFGTALKTAVDAINKDNEHCGLFLSYDLKKDECIVSLTSDFNVV